MPLCASELWTGSRGWGYSGVLHEACLGTTLRLKVERLNGDEGTCNLEDNPGVKLIGLDDVGNQVEDEKDPPNF